MLTNNVCTILRMNSSGGHDIIAAYDCMWQETESCEAKKCGEDNADKADIYIPDINADVKKGDCIFRGEMSEEKLTVMSVAMLTVTSVSRHDYGSESMRHVRIGAR